MENSIQILNKRQIQQKLERMAYQILEDNADESELYLAGIAKGGFILASRIQAILSPISPIHFHLVKIDLDKNSSILKAVTDHPLSEFENKTIIIIDDVLNTGKTLTYGLGVFLNLPIKKIRTLTLVDRLHRTYPLVSDFTGLEISTVRHQHVTVVLDESGVEDGVFLQ
jgi:pyrimidine operon attenuation protein / uracil phosphoribosyltransferase